MQFYGKRKITLIFLTTIQRSFVYFLFLQMPRVALFHAQWIWKWSFCLKMASFCWCIKFGVERNCKKKLHQSCLCPFKIEPVLEGWFSYEKEMLTTKQTEAGRTIYTMSYEKLKLVKFHSQYLYWYHNSFTELC